MNMDFAILCGTFNPIHNGHLRLAQTACNQLGLQTVYFISAFRPPHRSQDDDLASFQHRLAMAQRACQSNPAFQVLDIEKKLPTPSYSVQTVSYMAQQHGQNGKIPFIIGTDALAQLQTWHQWETLLEKCVFLQAHREGQDPITQVAGKALETIDLEMPPLLISSSLIRNTLKTEKSIAYLTPNSVIEYITWNKLYTGDKTGA